MLRHRFSWKRWSMAGALVYEPDGTDTECAFQMPPGAYNDDSRIELLIERQHPARGAQGHLDPGRRALPSQPNDEGPVVKHFRHKPARTARPMPLDSAHLTGQRGRAALYSRR